MERNHTEMSNEEKAKELAKECRDYTHSLYVNRHLEDKHSREDIAEQTAYASAIEMAQWKENQMIEKTVAWIKENVFE